MIPAGYGAHRCLYQLSVRVLIPVFVLSGACLSKLTAAARIDYTTQIKPIFAERCYACHGVLKQKGELRTDTAALLLHGGKHGAGFVAGKPDESRFFARISAREKDERMPPEGDPLKPGQIALLKLWIAQGARFPADEKPEPDPKDHWAFKAPVRPAVPKVKTREWAQNPIDAFIAAEHQKLGLKPQPLVKRSLWLRRVYLDLTGLPPGLKEIHEFEADKSPQAYEKVVDRLLASPQYGEHWGRHFMDIWRYSDWYGLGKQLRYSQKHLWHWRDWIVESLNADKGYDRMILEMLAGDEIAPTDPDTLRATGFLARDYYLFNRTTWLDEVVEHTSKAFLGLTMNCAKCHDHKYDPITSRDYYAWRAFFEPYHVRLDELPGQTDLEKDGLPRVYDVHLDTPTYLFIRGDEKNPDKSREIAPNVPVVFKFREPAIKPVQLPARAFRPGLQEYVFRDHLQVVQKQLHDAQTKWDEARKSVAKAEAKLDAAKSASAALPELRFKDDFARPKPDLWEQVGGKWKYVNGVLQQSETGSQRRVLRSCTNPPADFQAKFRFKITGGEKWKSVGFSFDATEDHDALVYLSAHAGSKLQVALSEKGKSTYPSKGVQSRAVKTGVAYELEVLAQGRQLTISVDGKEALKYELPRRQAGRFQLTTFDASAEFLSFELSELPAGYVPNGDSPETLLKQAKVDADLAAKNLAVARLRLQALRSAREADLAGTNSQPASLIAKAAEDDAALKLAEAEAALARLSEDTAGKQKSENDKKLKSARETLAKARERMKSPGTSYQSLRGSLKALEGPDEKDDHRDLPYPSTSSGRRTALAQWMADKRNPLTARVAVNHLWLRHFGQPLVPTVMDFGRRGTPPTHPELLDWLATELMQNGWSLKHMHRLMVLSRTYRLDSSNAGASKATFAKDAENKYYWRMNPVRMEAQSLRDSLLQLAGELDLTMGGPSIDPQKDGSVFRRSLYFTHSKEDTHKFLETFDNANVLECYRRSESILPQQALALSNSKISYTAAEKLVLKMNRENAAMSDAEFIRTAYETILAVEPGKTEQQACAETLVQLRGLAEKQGSKEPVIRARTGLVHALFNHNDFITVR